MNLFQWLVAPLLLGMSVSHLSRTIRVQERRAQSLFWASVWALGGVMVLRPDLSNALARLVGIGRGTDLVLYLGLIAGLFTAFSQYRQHRKLEIMVTELIRHMAVENAVDGAAHLTGGLSLYQRPGASDSSRVSGR
jgi:hypothetical protein